MDRRRVVVVGGGIAGLSFALDAVDAGAQVTLLERDLRLGGVVRSELLGSVHVDVGAESFALTRPDITDLAARLDLTPDVVRPATAQAHVMARGQLMPLPPGLLGIPADPDDIAALLGPTAALEARTRDGASVAEHAPTTIGRLVRDRLGDAVADVLVDPVLAGVHATRADDAELSSVAPSLYAAVRTHGGLMLAVRALRGALGPAGSPVATISGGMGRLVERLEQRLVERGVAILTAHDVTRLQLREDGVWQVRTSSGVYEADTLCLAIPAKATAALLHPLRGSAPSAIAASLRALPTTDDVVLVSLLVEDASLTRAGAPVGSGVLIADDTVQAKAMTHASAKWAWLAEALPQHQHVLRLSYGGTHALDPSGDDATLVTTARGDALRLLEGATDELRVLSSLVTRWQGALSRPIVGRSQELADIDVLLSSLPQLALTGSVMAGNGLAGVVGRSAHEARRIL